MATAISELSQLNAVTDTDLFIISHLSGESYVTRSLSAGNFATKIFVENQHYTTLSDVESQISSIPLEYSLISAGTVALEDRAIQQVVLTASSTQFVLPQLADGKVADFVLDIKNNRSSSSMFTLSGSIGVDFNIVLDENDDLVDMTILTANEIAEYYFTRTAFQLDNLPTWKISKKTVSKYVIPQA